MTEAERIENFIESHHKICWESEYENGEFCIGENKVRRFFNEGKAEHERLQQQIKEKEDSLQFFIENTKLQAEMLKAAQEFNRELTNALTNILKVCKSPTLTAHGIANIEKAESLINKSK